MLKISLIGILVLILIITSAAKPLSDASQWNINQFIQQNPVEQQTPGGATQSDESLWIINSTDCLWDSDDSLRASWRGRLNRGDMTTFTFCIVGDWSEHLVRLDISDGLVGTIAASEGPTATTCLQGPNYDNNPDNPLLEPIAGSNGGVGHIHYITVTANNFGKPRPNASVIVNVTIDAPTFLALCPPLTRLSGEPDWSTG